MAEAGRVEMAAYVASHRIELCGRPQSPLTRRAHLESATRRRRDAYAFYRPLHQTDDRTDGQADSAAGGGRRPRCGGAGGHL